MSEWYRVNRWNADISPVEVVKETPKQLVVRHHEAWRKADIESRRDKRSSSDNYFPTWEEAHAFLMEQADAKLKNARRALEVAQSHHGNVKGMKKPAARVEQGESV